MGVRGLLIILCVLSLAACGGRSRPTVDAPVGPAAYSVGPGDELRVTVYGEEELSGQYSIDGAGAISMPLLGQVQVGGRTLREVETHIQQSLNETYLYNPQVSAEVINYRPFYIMGEVMTPGEFPYRDGLSVLSAVALAGGFDYRAARGGITIKRGEEVVRVNDPAVVRVMPGDVVTVPERFF